MKVLEHGQYAEWEKPPAGVQKKCSCGATVETEEEEPTAVPTLQGSKDHAIKMGWDITCPECKRAVFIERPITKAENASTKAAV